MRIIIIIVLAITTSIFLTGFLLDDNGIGIFSNASGQDLKTDWPMWRHDLEHSGNTISRGAVTNQTLWKFNTGGQVGSPFVVDGIVYVGAYDRNVYAFRAADGVQIWNYATD